MSKYELMRSLNKSLDSPVETKITGTIPEWVQGTLFRNGPGRYEYGDKLYDHWFDGQAVVHKFQIKDGKVTYFNKLLETKCLQKTIEDNRLYPVFGTADVTSTLFGRLKTLFNQEPNVASDNTVNIIYIYSNHKY
jgi:beta,beta-carotene 9',10'-dioxygenase